MFVANYIIIVIIVIALGILYQKFCEKQYSIAGIPEGLDNYNEIKKYLLESSRIVLLCRFIDLRKNQLIFC